MFRNFYERYKDLPFWKRALLVFFLSGSYFSFDLLTKTEALEQEKSEQEERFFAQRKKLTKTLLEVKRLPGIKKNLIEAELEFSRSKKRLPDDFHIENLLETFSSIAKKNRLALDLFDPGIPSKEEESYTYISLPISVIVTGEFYHIVKFMESVLNQDQFLEIRNYKMDLELGTSSQALEGGRTLTESEKQHQARKDSKIRLEATIYAFRSLSEKEFNRVNEKDIKTNKKKKRLRK